MKKVQGIFVGAVMALSLAACSSTGTTASDMSASGEGSASGSSATGTSSSGTMGTSGNGASGTSSSGTSGETKTSGRSDWGTKQ